MADTGSTTAGTVTPQAHPHNHAHFAGDGDEKHSNSTHVNQPSPGGGQSTPEADSKEAVKEKEKETDSGTNGAAGTAAVSSGDAPHSDKIARALEGKVILSEADCYDQLGFSWPAWKKWTILTVVFWVQVSMNFNTSLYSNALDGISDEFGVSEQAARCGAMIFLILYAFGCELWAPWSEELGRKPILQFSLFLVNLWQLPVALAPNFAAILVGRALGGLSSAGGSVTLGMIADLWEAEDQQYAVAYVVFSSVGGSVLGPIVGGVLEQQVSDWRWCIWVQLIFGGVVQLAHLVLVPETRTTILVDKIAKRRRKAGEDVYGPTELIPWKERFSAKEILVTWVRPFHMYLTEPIVLTLSLLSGFSDALIFMFIQSFSLVYEQWGFNTLEIGLAFISIGIGYVVAWISFIPAIRRNIHERKTKPDDERAQFESRLWWLLYTAPCLPIGLICFAWTSSGSLVNHPAGWVASMFFAGVIGIANYSIYMATIDYMICAYGGYSASATGGNGWSRDFLAGVLTLPATPFFENIGDKPLQYASTILACIALLLVAAVYAIYIYGPVLRKRSPFAQHLQQARNEVHDKLAHEKGPNGERLSRLNTRQMTGVHARSEQDLRVRPGIGSRNASRANSRGVTPSHSRPVSRRPSMSEEASSAA